MEPPPSSSFFYHPPRYVPLIHHPPFPPSPHSFSDDPPNFYLPPPPPRHHPYHPLPPPPPPPYNPHFSFPDDYPHHQSRVRVPLDHSLQLGPSFRFRDNEFNPPIDFRADYDNRRGDVYCYKPNLGNYNSTPAFRDNDGRGRDIYGSNCNLNDFNDRAMKEIFGSNSNNLNDFNDRARKEIFKSSPNKQIQKKSALLRIEFNKKPSRNIKGNNNNKMEKVREGSPVELDVSFKSNSLVAKAIEVENNLNSMPKKRKTANIENLPSKKCGDGRVNLKKTVVRPMSCVTIPEKEKEFEPAKKNVSLKSVVVAQQLNEANMKLDYNNAIFDMGFVNNIDLQPSGKYIAEEDIYVDIGGSPVRNINEKNNSSPHLSSPPSVERIGIDEKTLSGDKSDGSNSCEETSVEFVSNVDNNVLVKSSDGLRKLDSDKNLLDITIYENKSVDFTTETNKAVVVPESSAADVEIKWNLVTPSTIDMFLKEISEATIVTSPPKDHISVEQHNVVSGTEKDSIFQSSNLLLDSCGNGFSSKRIISRNDTTKVVSVSSGTSTSGAELSETDGESIQLEKRDLDEREVASKIGVFSSVGSSPRSESPVLLLENIGEGVTFDDGGLSEEDLTENFQHGEKGSFGNSPYLDKRCNGKVFDAVKEQGIIQTESLQGGKSLENNIDTYQIQHVSDMECDPNLGSQETKQAEGQTSEEMDFEVILNQGEKPSAKSPSLAYSLPSLQNTKTNGNSGHSTGTFNSLNSKFVNSMKVGINTSKNMLPPAVPKVFKFNSSMTKTGLTNHNLKTRTWQRSSSPSTPLIPVKNNFSSSVYRRAQSPRVAKNIPSVAYVRKGNSLVRNSPPISASLKGTHAPGSSISCINASGINELERPNTPPLPCRSKIFSDPNISSSSGTSLPLVDPLKNIRLGAELVPSKPRETMDLLKTSNSISEFALSPEYSAGQIDNSGGGNLVPANIRKLKYVKRKANQLVAASSSMDLSPQDADKTEDLSSGGYFKRRENQLVRKSPGNGLDLGMPCENLNSQAKSASQIIASSFQRQSGKGSRKACKPSRFSLVWTLQNTESTKKETSLLSHVLPHLFPWKRAIYRRRFTYDQESNASNSSSSSISRNLLLSRQRRTIYKRSIHGLSLIKSMVLSVDGSSMKWSKSFGKNCRKANEEATLAVAAVERKKREKGGVTAPTKNRNITSRKLVHNIEMRPGERIFRVGSVRYKMDPTRRTLQRISDKELSCSFAIKSGKDAKKSSVPRRLVIGNQEYVRIGNGNQLIRDPKKRTRILANEKVRWSLHTARLCLARKNKFCQFFTRFGKCNKGDGKCPYIHDLEKVAVCTKFLRSSCSDSNCKLTHKVIPERMEDCSFFIQGLCSNETCPYRHVNVNPKAYSCEGFLRGYCSDGNECRKKHSYVCPSFESTGSCPQISKCKLNHPQKNQNKVKRSEYCKGKNNIRGRYFGSEHIGAFDTKITVFNKHFTEDDDDMFFQEGKFADFIPLDVSDKEDGIESFNSKWEQTSFGNSFGNSLGADLDIGDLIKPVGLMKRKLMKESSPTV